MSVTGRLILAPGALLTPACELSGALRRQIGAQDGDFALTRSHARTPARVVDAESARLIEEFRDATTIVEAVLRYCAGRGGAPEAILEEAWPLLQRLVETRFLIAPESAENGKPGPLLEPGMRFAGDEVIGCVQTTSDTDVYRIRRASGGFAALKAARLRGDAGARAAFEHEARILTRIGARNGADIAPTLLDSGKYDGHCYLIASWCEGEACSTVAARLRMLGDKRGLLRLCLGILEAYAKLHAGNIVHGDVHPRNILAGPGGGVRLIDFGLARDADDESDSPRRGGVAWFMEPEFAEALRRQDAPPQASMRGEQYALGALLCYLMTGRHALNFSLERGEMLRQIAEDPPLPGGLEGWPQEVRAVLDRALEKDPGARFSSVAAFAGALRGVVRSRPGGSPGLGKRGAARRLLKEVLEELQPEGSLMRTGVAAPRAALMHGSAGIACALRQIAGARQDAQMLSLADVWMERAARDAREEDAWSCANLERGDTTNERGSLYQGEAGLCWTEAAIAGSMGDFARQQSALDRFAAMAAAEAEGNLDLLAGQCGMLLGASLLLPLADAGPPVDFSGVLEAGRAALRGLWKRIDGWESIAACGEMQHTGMAHGWAGLLYATLCWCRAAGDRLPADADERLQQLAALAWDDGRRARWSWDLRQGAKADRETFAAGWCHGSAGQAHLWLAAGSLLKEERYLALAERAALDAAESESMNGSLCCGFTGQAYAQLALYRESGEAVWLRRAERLAERAAGMWKLPVREAKTRHSLYQGRTGTAVLAADLENPLASGMPAFEAS